MSAGLIKDEQVSLTHTPLHKVALACILLAYLVTAGAYNISIPVGEAPDEPAHIQNVQVILRTGQLPTIPRDSPRYSYEAEQPPLYYLSQAGWIGLLWPDPQGELLPELTVNPEFDPTRNFTFDGGMAPNLFLRDYTPAEALPTHLMRVLSMLFGLATLLLVWGTARLAWPEHPGSALAAVGLAAFIPGFAFSSATVNNDALAFAASAAVLFACVYMLRNGVSHRMALVTGLLLGLGLLSKRSLLVLVPIVFLLPLLILLSNRDKQIKDSRFIALRAGAMVGLAALGTLVVGAWPFISNWVEYGDPMATAATASVKSEIGSPLEGRPGYWLSPGYFVALFNSFWGAFGIRNIDLPNLLYAGYYVLCLLALVGLVRYRRGLERVERGVLWLCVAVIVLVNVGVAYQNTQFWAVQGRLLLPALAALVLPIGRGLALVGAHLLPAGRERSLALGALLCVLLAADWYALVAYLIGAYYR